MQVRLELAAIEMAPDPLGGVVERRELEAALRAGPLHPAWMGGEDIDPSVLDVKLDVLDGPRRWDSQEVLIELDVLQEVHPDTGIGGGLRKATPTEPGRAHIFRTVASPFPPPPRSIIETFACGQRSTTSTLLSGWDSA